MAAPMQLGIQISVTGGKQGAAEIGQTARAANDLNQGARAGAAGLDQIGLSASRLLLGGAGLYMLTAGIASLSQAVLSLPKSGFDYSKDLEASAVGMAGILGSMATMHGRQLEYNQALSMSQDMIQKLGDDALRTAASSAELTSTFQALLAPGLAARMTLDQIRQLTVVGVNAVKSIGLSGAQVTQELRDLVSGGITAGGSQLATALGLKDADIAKAKASSEGLFAFLMDKLKGFEASSTKFGDTLQGRMDSLKEGAVRVVAQGMQPLTNEVSTLAGEMSGLLVTFDKAGTAQINPKLVGQLREYSTSAVQALHTTRDLVSGVWEHRDAVVMLAQAYAVWSFGTWAVQASVAVAAKLELAQASRLAAVQQAAEAVTNTEVVLTSRQKVAAYLAELQAKYQVAQANVLEAAALEATTAARVAELRAVVLSTESNVVNAEVVRNGLVPALGAATAATLAKTEAERVASIASAQLAAAQGAAGTSARIMGSVIGALGGPVGIAIIAVSSLAMWLYKLKSAADDAATARMKYGRAIVDSQNGKSAEEGDIAAIRAEMQRLKDARDALIVSGDKVANYEFNGTPLKLDESGFNAQIKSVERDLALVQNAQKATADSTQGLALTLAGSRQGWEASIADAKTATSAQEEYTRKLQASQSAYKAYESAIKASGKSEAEVAALLTQAQQRQRQAETAFAKERDEQLRNAAKSGGDYENLRKTLLGQIAVEQAKLGSTRQLTDAEKDRAQFLAEYDRKVLHLSASEAAAITGLHDKRVAVERLQVAEKARIKDAQAAYAQEVEWADEVAAAEVAASKAREQGWLALDEYARATRESGEAVAFESGLLGVNTEQRAIAIAQHQIELDLKKKINEINANTGFDQSQRDDAIARASATAEIAKQGAVAKAQLDTFSSTLQSIDSTGREVFASLFESGHSAFKSLGQTLKKELIDMLYELTLKKWVISVGASISGNMASSAMGTVLGSGTGASGSGSGLLSTLGSASSLSNALGLSSFSGAAGFMTNFGNAALAATQSMVGLTGTTAQMASSLSAAGAAGGNALATSLGAYVPYIGAVLLVASQWKNIFGGKTSVQGQGIDANVSAGTFTAQSYTDYHKSGGWFSSGKSWTDYSALTPAVSQQLQAGYTSVQTAAANAAQSLGLSSSALDSYSEHFKVTLGSDAAKNQEAITAAFSDLADHLAAAVAPSAAGFAKTGETAGQTLSRLSASITQVNSWLGVLSQRMLAVSLVGADAASAVADAFGGLENFTSAAKSFYDSYYSDAQKIATSQAQMRQQLAAVGLTLPDNKAAFKALADSLDLTTDAGRKAYAVMLTVAPQFAQTFDLATQAADAAAKTLVDTFTGRTGVVPALDVAHLSAQSLQDQLLALQLGADKAGIGITALSASLSGVSTTEYVAVLDNIFTALSTRLQSVVDAINNERTAVSNAALQIINPTVLSRDEITRRIASVNTTLPSNAGVVAAQSALSAADASVAQKQAAQTNANAVYSAAAAAQSSAVASYGAVADRFHEMATYYGITTDHGFGSNEAYNYDPSTGRLLNWTSNGGGWDIEAASQQFNKDARVAASANWTSATGIIGTPDGVVSGNGQVGSLVYQLANANATLAPLWNNLQAAAAAQTTAAAATAAAQSTQTAATSAAAAATTAYAAALQDFTADAGKSVTKLTKLREETVKYYEAQAKLASLMTASADGIRKTVADYQLTQMTDAQKYASLASQFSKNYSLALATTGETAAGYADKLNALINPIIEAANAVGGSLAVGGASADSLVASYLAQANAVATRLDSNVTGLGDYQSDSLGLLGSIDATLAALDASSKSAEAIISDAVKAGADQTAAGLHAVIAAITGQTIPAFATGGAFTGGVVSRPTMFDMGLMGEAGPEGILPLTSVGGKLGVHARIGKGQAHGQPINQDALLAELQALRAQVAELHQVLDNNTGTIAINTGKTARLHTRWDADGLPATRADTAHA